VVCKKIASVGAIEISSQVCQFIANEETSALILKQIDHRRLTLLLAKVNNLRARIILAKSSDDAQATDFPAVDIANLLATMETWLLPYLSDVTSGQQLTRLNWADIIHSMITYSQLQYLNEYYPTHFMAPTGNKHVLDYSEAGEVTLAIRIQELYGLEEHPSLGKGKLPITLSLLSPAHRLIQKTADLITFWTGSYKAVQKDMKGKYPRHYWPEVPQNAMPTTKTKKKM
jgi:ATP-dependent helicase HrpB